MRAWKTAFKLVHKLDSSIHGVSEWLDGRVRGMGDGTRDIPEARLGSRELEGHVVELGLDSGGNGELLKHVREGAIRSDNTGLWAQTSSRSGTKGKVLLPRSSL